MRRLATIRQVKDVSPINGADLIELINVGGWQCVSLKGEFNPGVHGVYFEIDSFIPVEPRYEFLRKSSYKKMPDGTEGFRIKTVKLQGVLSQGLMMPLSLFPEINDNTSIGDDVTRLLKITKYEPPIPPQLAGSIKGMFPTKIRQTDQERIQNLWEVYSDKYRNVLFEVSLKLDGVSMSVYYDNGDFGVCSRNIDLKEEDRNSFWRIARRLYLQEVLTLYNKPIAIQGELIGSGIEGNNEKLKDLDFYVFDIWDIEKQMYCDPITRKAILNGLNNIAKDIPNNISKITINHVPVLGYETLGRFESLDEVLAYAEGASINPLSKREGVVFKSITHINNEIVSFKVINNAYLLNQKNGGRERWI